LAVVVQTKMKNWRTSLAAITKIVPGVFTANCRRSDSSNFYEDENN